MLKFRAEETINRSAEDVWAFAADVEQHGRWMGISEAHLVSGRPREVGARGRQRLELDGQPMEAEIEITAADPGRRFAHRTVGGVPFTFEGIIDVERLGPHQSRVVWSGWMEFEPAMTAMEAEMSGASSRRKWRLASPSRGQPSSAREGSHPRRRGYAIGTGRTGHHRQPRRGAT